MDDFARQQHGQAAHETLSVPTDDKPDSDAQCVTTQQKRVSREPGERLFGFLVVPHDGILNRLRTISVVGEIFTESGRKMPDAYYKKSKHNCPAGVVKRFP